jgi:hypothetical protein
MNWMGGSRSRHSHVKGQTQDAKKRSFFKLNRSQRQNFQQQLPIAQLPIAQGAYYGGSPLARAKPHDSFIGMSQTTRKRTTAQQQQQQKQQPPAKRKKLLVDPFLLNPVRSATPMLQHHTLPRAMPTNNRYFIDPAQFQRAPASAHAPSALSPLPAAVDESVASNAHVSKLISSIDQLLPLLQKKFEKKTTADSAVDATSAVVDQWTQTSPPTRTHTSVGVQVQVVDKGMMDVDVQIQPIQPTHLSLSACTALLPYTAPTPSIYVNLLFKRVLAELVSSQA